MDKLFNVDKKTLIFLLIICFIGLLTGSIFMTILNSNDKNLINETITGFLNNVNKLNLHKMFIS